MTVLSDGTEVELCFKGREKQVTLENLDEYIDLLVQISSGKASDYSSLQIFVMQSLNGPPASADPSPAKVTLNTFESTLFFLNWEYVSALTC